MIRLSTIRELFLHNDWAFRRLLAAAEPLQDAQLDRPFDMGLGSLRATLEHLSGVERGWLDRWQAHPAPRFPYTAAIVAIPQLGIEFESTVADRNAFLSKKSDSDLEQRISYVNRRGETWTYPLGQMLLHVCNHGVYHRAQAVNMLRHLGAALPKPEIDYIFMRLDPAPPPPTYDVATIQAYYAYADWARETVLAIAATLSDAQLDRRFDMGLGTLRKTLVHIRDAEQWWLENWTGSSGTGFPDPAEGTSMGELVSLSRNTADRRNEILASLTERGLDRTITVNPRPNVSKHFPLGVTMLQICAHGTHHRAQAVNMLRHLGAAVPRLDYLEMIDALTAK